MCAMLRAAHGPPCCRARKDSQLQESFPRSSRFGTGSYERSYAFEGTRDVALHGSTIYVCAEPLIRLVQTEH